MPSISVLLLASLASIGLVTATTADPTNGYSVQPTKPGSGHPVHPTMGPPGPPGHPGRPPHGGCDSPKRVVGGYVASWAAYEPTWYLSDIPYQDLTHAWYSFIYLRTDGRIEVGDPDMDLFGLPDEEKEKIVDSLDPRPPPEEVAPEAPLNATLQPGIPFDIPVGKNLSSDIGLKWLRDNKNVTGDCKIMVALGGWNWSQNFAGVAADETKRTAFAESVKEFLDEWELDGIDIDWEYPTAERVNGTLADTKNFVLLMKELRASIGEEKIISAAISASTIIVPELNNQSLIQASVDIELAQYVDMFNVMGYDFAGYWSEVVTHDAPLYGDISVGSAIAQLKEIGVPATQLNLGVPAYGYMFYNTDGTGMGGNMTTEGNRIQGTWDTVENNMSWTGNFDYSHIQQAFAVGNPDWSYEFDNATAGSWLWNKEKGLVLTYDSVEAVQVKSDYANAEGLGGMFVWEMSNDRDGDLIGVMNGKGQEHTTPETTRTKHAWGPGESR